MERRYARVLVCLILAAYLITGSTLLYMDHPSSQSSSSQNKLGFNISIHCLITMYDNGKMVFQQYHAGSLTNLGYNYTMGKILGNSTYYNMTQYNLNITYISIGDGTPTQASTYLPLEWNRTNGVLHDATYNVWNQTGTIKPDVGPYNASCIGLDFSSPIGANTLWGYDTFTRVTGITNTFTITIEFKVTIT